MGTVKHGFEIGLYQIGDKYELIKLALTDYYIIADIKRYRKKLLKQSLLIFIDTFFSPRTFYEGIQKHGFHLINYFHGMPTLVLH